MSRSVEENRKMPQMNEVAESTYRSRIVKLQEAMKEFGLGAVVLEPGPAMLYLTGVRWGRSERTFAVVLPEKGEPVYVLPGFEEMRARELIHVGKDIRIWQEDESPYQRIAEALRDRGVTAGRIGIDDSARFFVFDGIRKLAPKLDYVSAQAVLRSAGVDTAQPQRTGGRR
jgi:Xaa-Pro dipeptidase